MRLETTGKDFLTVMEVTSKLLNEVKLECDRDGIRFSGLDNSHICFINMIMDRDYFLEYECDEPETLIVDCDEFLKVLKRMKSDDVLRIHSSEDSLSIIFEGEATRTFNLRLISSDYDTPMMPSLSYPNEPVELSFKEYVLALKDAQLYNMKVYLCSLGEEFLIRTDGDKGSYINRFDVLGSYDKAESCFSLEYLLKFNSLARISDKLMVKLGNEMPLTLKVCDEIENLSVTLLLAPRIEEDY